MFVFFGPIGKTRWPSWPLIGRDMFDFTSETAEPNSTKHDRKQDFYALYQVCVFRADRKNKMAAPASDWLRHFRLLWRNCWTEINETWQEARSQRPLPRLCFSGWSGKNMVSLYYRTLDGCIWDLVGIECSWPRTCIKVFPPYPPRGRAKIGQGGLFFKKLLFQIGRLQQPTESIAMI